MCSERKFYRLTAKIKSRCLDFGVDLKIGNQTIAIIIVNCDAKSGAYDGMSHEKTILSTSLTVLAVKPETLKNEIFQLGTN
ncbi:large tegument protein deneddylase [Plakobranchus ocellatus]|uniref:Large tegument protein deneddylase n=1 Tax=Plakobranchus ocellatus TaxID=259542 RepID=A0AAV3XVL9_9GAST|nr:large tegument protein deneddylase [Plakobranchus ocellatus]